MTKTINHAERAHALLSASSSSRWLACTPSARLEEQFPDKSSVYAEEGTLAHEIAELKLRKHFIEPISQMAFTSRLNKLKKHDLFQDEMLKHTETYLDYLKELTIGMKTTPYVAVEKRLSYQDYAPEGFGTVDCIVIGGGTMHVTDFKYGKGVPVSAENNTQMKLYALGAFQEYSILYNFETVKLAIVQPRLDSVSEFEIPVGDLLAWGEKIKPLAQKAYSGEGEFVPGEHCKFCRAKAQCRARAEEFSALEDFADKKPPLLTNEEVGKFLTAGEHIAAWVKDLKVFALKETLKGNEVPGWKAVEGRGSRNYTNIDAAFEHLKKEGFDESLLYERIPLTVPKLEKELGKKKYRELLDDPGHVEKLPGKPTLAKENDSRKAISVGVKPEDDFK